MKLQSPDKAVAPQWRCYCLFLLLSAGMNMSIFGAATADEAKEASCRHVGAIAQAIAEARDLGLSMEDTIAAVGPAARIQDRKMVSEAARLLFLQFRRMPPPAAAFEFYMDCIDNDG